MFKKNKNILFCALDIGGRMELYSSYLKNKYPARKIKTFAKYKLNKKHYQTSYDYHFNYINQPAIVQYVISFFFFIYALTQFKVFYIISGENILTRKLLKLELRIYRSLNKTVVMHFVGGDIRNSERLIEKNRSLIDKSNDQSKSASQLDFQFKLCRLAEKYADHLVVVSPDLIRFFEREVSYIPVFIDIEKFKEELNKVNIEETNNHQRKVILHAPSNPVLKGSDYIGSILKELEQDGKVEAILTTDEKYRKFINPPYTVTKYELLKLYKLSDFVIDQILIGWYGMQSIESLLAGNNVICLVNQELLKYITLDCPIHLITEENQLKSKIEELVNVQAESLDLELVTKWVRKHHTIEENEEINQLFKTILN